jgi:predicted transcriptional regulator
MIQQSLCPNNEWRFQSGAPFVFCNLSGGLVSHTIKAMEVHLTPEQESQLAVIATSEGINIEQLVKEAALGLLDEDARFRAAVREGIAQADRGEFIEEEEMNARLEHMLRS